MTLQSVVASNELLGLLLTVALVAVTLRNQSFLRELRDQRYPGWSKIPALAAGATGLFIAWTSLFDNWRQLTGIPFHAMRRFASQKVQVDPPSDAVRTVTWLLLAISLVLVSALVARHVGGYLLLVPLLFAAFAAWLPIFVIRQRLNLDLAMGFGGDWTSPVDLFGYLAFVVFTLGFDIALVVVSYATLLALVALPVTLLLDLARLRRPRATTEAATFFGSIGERARTTR